MKARERAFLAGFLIGTALQTLVDLILLWPVR